MKKPSLSKRPAQPVRKPSVPAGFNNVDYFALALLVLIAAGFWCYVTGRVNAAAWQVPLEYGVAGADADAQAVFSHMKAASEGEFYPFLVKNISRLGAPYYGNWSDFPIVEEWQFFLPGVLAKFIGLFAAANMAVMVAQLLACVSFYLVARWMGVNRAWSFAGGLMFGFAQFALARSIHHLMVTNYWYVPFFLLIAGWVSRGEMGEYRGKRYIFALIASFIFGMQNPYYVNMYLQLAMLGAFYQYFRQGWRPVFQVGGLIVASGIGFFLMDLDTLVYHLQHGPNPGAFLREYRWLELSALKFVDLLIPPPDHGFLGGIGRYYYYQLIYGKSIPGEMPPSCYLGLAGLAALAWLIVVSLRRLVIETGRNLPMEAWQVMWILAYSVVGGLNCLAGVFGMVMFRSSTRYCIFILPILLLFALKRLSRMRIDPAWSFVAAGVCAFFALWDQTPPAVTEQKIASDAQIVYSDRDFTHEIEGRLPKGAMIFQLPVIEFPETPVPGVTASEHFRPYLHSEHLRFSFGGMKGRPWEQWQLNLQQNLAKSPFVDFVRAVESYGFSGVYVNRNGFQDKAAGVLKAFDSLGYHEVIESRQGDLFLVVIHPDSHPVLPAGVVR